MTNDDVMNKLQAMEARLTALEDIESIKILQRAYGYYLEHWMAEDLIDLFADGNDTTLTIAAGQFHGKEAVSRLFRSGNKERMGPEFMHQVMQLSGVVHVDPDGRTAKGRWYGFGANAFPVPDGKVSPGWMDGVYEVDYLKENGIWKLKKVQWCMTFHAPWGESFVAPEKRLDVSLNRPYEREPHLRPTGSPEETQYPSGYICPFHFTNPVTGRKTIQQKKVD